MLSAVYHSAIGDLMYLIFGTFPYLALTACILAKFVELPRVLHWSAGKLLHRYFIQIKYLCLPYGGSDADPTPIVFLDADWVGYYDVLKSMSVFFILFSGAAVAWYAHHK